MNFNSAIHEQILVCHYFTIFVRQSRHLLSQKVANTPQNEEVGEILRKSHGERQASLCDKGKAMKERDKEGKQSTLVLSTVLFPDGMLFSLSKIRFWQYALSFATCIGKSFALHEASSIILTSANFRSFNVWAPSCLHVSKYLVSWNPSVWRDSHKIVSLKLGWNDHGRYFWRWVFVTLQANPTAPYSSNLKQIIFLYTLAGSLADVVGLAVPYFWATGSVLEISRRNTAAETNGDDGLIKIANGHWGQKVDVDNDRDSNL